MPDNPYDTTIRAEDGEGIYLFCFARPPVPPVLNVRGPDVRYAVSQWTFQDITAVFSKVSLEDFCGSEAESRMKDPAWIGPRACRHEDVVEQVMRSSPVFPARFGTVFSSIDSLDNLLYLHKEIILQFLDHVVDKQEWSLKSLMDSAKAKEKLYAQRIAADAEHLASLSPGARYFQEKRIQSDIGGELNRRYQKKIEQVAESLDQYAADFCTRKLLSRAAAGTDMDMIANWAYLVPINILKKFRAQVDRANEIHGPDGLVFRLSGPWPPYSFCPSLEIVD